MNETLNGKVPFSIDIRPASTDFWPAITDLMSSVSDSKWCWCQP
jgi:hypothetical protein